MAGESRRAETHTLTLRRRTRPSRRPPPVAAAGRPRLRRREPRLAEADDAPPRARRVVVHAARPRRRVPPQVVHQDGEARRPRGALHERVRQNTSRDVQDDAPTPRLFACLVAARTAPGAATHHDVRPEAGVFLRPDEGAALPAAVAHL